MSNSAWERMSFLEREALLKTSNFSEPQLKFWSDRQDAVAGAAFDGFVWGFAFTALLLAGKKTTPQRKGRAKRRVRRVE